MVCGFTDFECLQHNREFLASIEHGLGISEVVADLFWGLFRFMHFFGILGRDQPGENLNTTRSDSPGGAQRSSGCLSSCTTSLQVC